MSHERPTHDVVIIGGGPAGSSMAAYLGRAGVKCLVLEHEIFPRPHVGESLVPSSTRVFSDLGFLDVMEARKFPHKFGAAWTSSGPQVWEHYWTDDKPEDLAAIIRFEERDQPGVNQNYTYHVDRGEFDHELLKHAHRLGAEVQEGVRVRGVEFEAGRLSRVRYAVNGTETHATARTGGLSAP